MFDLSYIETNLSTYLVIKSPVRLQSVTPHTSMLVTNQFHIDLEASSIIIRHYSEDLLELTFKGLTKFAVQKLQD